jgi:L-amino acid N-acyltransferase YncA
MVPGLIRSATPDDLSAIRAIYNQGIEDRIATLDQDPKSEADIENWYAAHGNRYAVLVAIDDGAVCGWAALNRYSPRSAYDGVADLSIYVRRELRGRGIGGALLGELESAARANGFHKLVLFTFDFNALGRRLYRRSGFRDVGTFRRQGRLDGRFVDVVAMEKVF